MYLQLESDLDFEFRFSGCLPEEGFRIGERSFRRAGPITLIINIARLCQLSITIGHSSEKVKLLLKTLYYIIQKRYRFEQ
jgi:hypothetical protein